MKRCAANDFPQPLNGIDLLNREHRPALLWSIGADCQPAAIIARAIASE
jgi:hypothetical protein